MELVMRWVFIVWCLLFASVVSAQPKTAKEEFETAERLYQLGEYEKALGHYKESYVISGEPLILYNIGQSYRYLGRNQEALEAYQLFLQKLPKSKYRSNAEIFVKELTVTIANEKKNVQPTTKPAESQPIKTEVKPPETIPVSLPASTPASAAFTQPPPKLVPIERGPSLLVPIAFGGAAAIPGVISLLLGNRVAQQEGPESDNGANGPELQKQVTTAKVIALTADVLLLGAAVTGGRVLLKKRQAEKN
jgi:hypothetical protein